MPVVKRFRPLGQVRLNRSDSNLEQAVFDDKKSNFNRFEPLSERKRRSDRKHRYPLRCDPGLWERILEFSLNCGGSASGASLNVILNKLISSAMDDEMIVKNIIEQFPERLEFIRIRSWRNK